MQQVDLSEDIKAVRDSGPIKVWSVVVTILGDLLQDEAAMISGPLLAELMGRLGINNQALRVALHRLRRDGWVVTEKRGRMSAHQLSAQGWRATEAVRPQVYGSAEAGGGAVALWVGAARLSLAEFEAVLPEGAVMLSTRSALVPAACAVPLDCVACPFAPSDVPDWVTDSLAPKALRADYAALVAAVEAVAAGPVPADVMETAALRLVVLHHWRRLCLRHGAVQDQILPENWEGAEARRLVQQALTKLPRPSIDALEQRLLQR